MNTPPRGFSFTTMFFGPIPVLLRGDAALAGWIFLVFLLSLVPFIGLFMLPFFFLVPAMVNRVYEERLTNPDAKFFPLQGKEAAHAVTYFVVWAVVMILLFGVIGCAAALVVA